MIVGYFTAFVFLLTHASKVAAVLLHNDKNSEPYLLLLICSPQCLMHIIIRHIPSLCSISYTYLFLSQNKVLYSLESRKRKMQFLLQCCKIRRAGASASHFAAVSLGPGQCLIQVLGKEHVECRLLMVSRCPVSLHCGLVSRKAATTERSAFVQEMTGLTALQLSGLVLIAYVHLLH